MTPWLRSIKNIEGVTPLNPLHIELLAHLEKTPKLTKTIADAMGTKSQRISPTLRDMEGMGLVKAIRVKARVCRNYNTTLCSWVLV